MGSGAVSHDILTCAARIRAPHKPPASQPIAFYFRDAVALSGERYKLVAAEQSKGKRSGGSVSFSGKKFELFDLLDDPGETADVAQDHPELVAEMKAQLRHWVDSVEQSRLGKDYESANSSLSTTPASGRRTHLFLCSGQSNMKNLDLNVSFTPALKRAFPEDEVIVTKVAYGGRAIARWVPRGKIYKELLTEAKAATAGKKIDTVTLVWMQGERDHQEDATTRSYKRNHETLYGQLTEDFKRDDINWVIGRLSDARLGTANWDAIRQIQIDVADKHPRAAWIDTDDLNGPTNAIHCPPEGYKQMGTRFAEKAVGLIKQSSTPRAKTTIPEGVNVRIIPLAKPLDTSCLLDDSRIHQRKEPPASQKRIADPRRVRQGGLSTEVFNRIAQHQLRSRHQAKTDRPESKRRIPRLWALRLSNYQRRRRGHV